MLSWLAKRMIARTMARTSADDLGPTLKMDAEAWLQRFAEAGPQISPDEVVLKGFPWKQTICIRGTDYLNSPEGERVYENRHVIWGRISWGLLREHEVYEDTQKSKALDQYLASTGDVLSRRAIGQGS